MAGYCKKQNTKPQSCVVASQQRFFSLRCSFFLISFHFWVSVFVYGGSREAAGWRTWVGRKIGYIGFEFMAFTHFHFLNS